MRKKKQKVKKFSKAKFVCIKHEGLWQKNFVAVLPEQLKTGEALHTHERHALNSDSRKEFSRTQRH